ncbi:MAG: class I SAM-dependent methyltransferase [Planctomycetota bacterium]|nr:class I SAM-dependent methyltransferase [Planctomycetota bacterium]
MSSTSTRTHMYPATRPDRQPSPWWYYGRALYVSRRDYFKIYCVLMATLGIPMVFVALKFNLKFVKIAALGAGTVSLFYLGYSLIVGMYRMYGHPGKRYIHQLLQESETTEATVVADVHIGTYRHSYILADLLPGAVIHSVDCWGVPGEPHEIAIRDVRDLECAPTHHPRIHPAQTDTYTLPLPDESCDVVVLGFGTHEIPDDGPLERIFTEARRVLKPGGKALMFEHGVDFHNVIIYGPVISHVIPRYEWSEKFLAHFCDIGYARAPQAVDLFWGTRGETVGSTSQALPQEENRRTARVFVVIGAFTLISLGVVAYLPEKLLVNIYLGIAIMGVAWPWLMIGIAILGDRSTRTKVAAPPDESHGT